MRRIAGVIGFALGVAIFSACSASSSGSSASTESVTSQPAASTVSATSKAPLDGVWVAEFTCEDVVAALKRIGAVDHAAGAMEAYEGTTPPKSDPCRGAPETLARTFTFDGDHLVGYTEFEGVGLDVLVRFKDDTFVIPGDPGDPDYAFAYSIDGDRLTVKNLNEDPGWVSAWEMAPFTRQP